MYRRPSVDGSKVSSPSLDTSTPRTAGHSPTLPPTPQNLPKLTPNLSIDERKLFAESHGVFVHLQRQVSSSDDIVKVFEAIQHAAQQYQSISASRSLEVSASEGDLARAALYRATAMIWHLTEIFFLISPEELAAPFLSEWFSRHLGDVVSKMELYRLAQLPRPENDPSYWKHVYKYAVNGSVDHVRALLTLHSRWRHLRGDLFDMESIGSRKVPIYSRNFQNDEDKLLAFLESLLANMPRPNSLLQGSDFSEALEDWREQISKTIDNNPTVRQWPELKTLLKLLCADRESILHYAENWRDYLIAHVTYIDPLVSLGDVKHIVADYLEEFGEDSDTKDIVANNVIQSAIASDVRGFVRHVSGLGSLWLTAHLVDLLVHAQWIDDDVDRCRFLVDYANRLLDVGGFGAVPLSYLFYGITNKSDRQEVMSKVILGFPLQSERDAIRLLEYCYQFDLVGNVIRAIHRNMADVHFKNRNYSSALTWHIRGGVFVEDNTLQTLICSITDSLCTKPLFSQIGESSAKDEFVLEASHLLVAVADALAELDFDFDLQASAIQPSSPSPYHTQQAILIRNSQLGISAIECVFLCKYATALRLHIRGESLEAVRLLLLILKAEIAPKRTWPSIVADIISLVQRNHLQLRLAEAQVLIRSFDDARSSKTKQTKLSFDGLGEVSSTFPLALSQILADSVTTSTAI